MRKFLKKILLWLKKNPPKYKLLLVFWEDANASLTWEEIPVIEKLHPSICMSVGYLINKTDDSFVLTSDFSFDEKNADFVISEGGNTLVSPTKYFLKIEELPLKYKFK